jgi:hypothetical protein
MDLITSIPPKISRRAPSGEDVGLEYLSRCIQSWIRNGFNVTTLNREDEAEHIRTLFKIDPLIFEDERGAMRRGRYGPSFEKIFSGRDLSRPVCIANADVYVLDSNNLSEKIDELCQDALVFAHRTDFVGSESTFYTNYKHGVDFVAFRPDKLLQVLEDNVFKKFKLGLVWWDCVLPVAASFFIPILRIREPFILHHMHERAWDGETYDQIRALALDVLLRLARTTRASNEAAALFAERAETIDLATKKGTHGFFRLCTDWLAGLIGPVRELQLTLDADNAALTEMLRSVLDYGTRAKGEVEAGRRDIVRLQARIAEREKDILKLRFRLRELKRTNSRLSKSLAKVEARGSKIAKPLSTDDSDDEVWDQPEAS